MADRRDYFFKQRVTESELDAGFEKLEEAGWNLAADIGIYGIISGAVPTQHSPVANLTIDLTGPAKSYDRFGRRVYLGTDQNVDVSVDENGVPTTVATVGHERWLAVFVGFDRNLDDERIDGNGQAVFFVRDESFQIIVRQGASAAAGTAVKVALDDQLLLVCDIKRSQGVATILDAVIDTSRRQGFVMTDAEHIELAEHVWSVVTSGTVQGALEELDAAADAAATALTDLANQADAAKGAALVGFAAEGGLDGLAAGTLRAALSELSDKVTDHKASLKTGAHHAGNILGPNIDSGTVTLTGDTLNDYLLALQTYVEGHVTDTAGAHQPSAINGLTVTTGAVEITGATLSAFLGTLQAWIYSNVERRIATATVTALAAGATTFVMADLPLPPTRVHVRPRNSGWAADEFLQQGAEVTGLGWSAEQVAVQVMIADAVINVAIKNNTANAIDVFVEAFRVG